MTQDTIAFLEQVVDGPAHLVGHSAGANMALLVTLRRPDLARRVVVISGVFHRDGWIPSVIDPDLEPHEALARGYAELSPDSPDHFDVVATKHSAASPTNARLLSIALGNCRRRRTLPSSPE